MTDETNRFAMHLFHVFLSADVAVRFEDNYRRQAVKSVITFWIPNVATIVTQLRLHTAYASVENCAAERSPLFISNVRCSSRFVDAFDAINNFT